MMYLDFTQGDLDMKKENKKLAQVQRAKAKKAQKIKGIVAKVLQIAIPSIVFLAIVVIALTNPFAKGETSDNGTSTESTTMNLLTDTSLEVTDGCTVNIDYVGSIDGVEFQGGNTQGAGTDLVIGSGSYIDDFEEQLIGAHPGDTVEVNVTFPEDYGNEELNGKEAVFEVVVNGIYE